MRPMREANLEALAGRPGGGPPSAARWPGWRQLAGQPVVISVLVTVAGTVVWLTVFPRIGTDLSAQLARAG